MKELSDILFEQFAPTAEEEAKKVNDQTGINLVTDQAFWEKMGIVTGEDLAKDLLAQTYSDYYKDLHGIRPRWMADKITNMSTDEIQALIDELDLEAERQQADKEEMDAWWEERRQTNEPGFEDEMMSAVKANPDDVPDEYKELENLPGRSGMGRRTESKMKITTDQVRQIIKEEISRVLNELGPKHGVPSNRAQGNSPPDRDSNWSQFAAELDIGVMDLDEIAYTLGFRDFADMDISISPRALADKDSRAFIEAAQSHSLAAEDMSPDEILTHAGASGGI